MRRRTVLYLSGFDPQGAAHYHALYQDEAKRQAAVSGHDMTVGPRVREQALVHAWSVRLTDANGQHCDTRYAFLRWDDIVRRFWPRSWWALMGVTLGTTARLMGNGSLWRMLQTSWPAFVALALPASSLFFLGSLLLSGLGISAWLATRGEAAAALVGLGTAAVTWRLETWIRHRAQTAWLMRSARVILMQARGELPALEERLDRFADQLLAEVHAPTPSDEVLVVGHSSGAMLAISVVARALARDSSLLQGPVSLSLLTLGECVPVLSYQPEAEAFRQELRRLRQSKDLSWVDVTAPPDGCCFALIDPTAVCDEGPQGMASADSSVGLHGPKRLSARFAQMFSAARYKVIRRDKHRCHFQYLMASERPVEYDYFAITAGTLRLRDRYAASPSITDFRQFQRFGTTTR